MKFRTPFSLATVGTLGLVLTGCDSSWRQPLPQKENTLAPATQPVTDKIILARDQITPLHQEMLAIDLPAIARVVMARNLDILAARRRVEGAHGQLASSIGAAFPVEVLSLGFNYHQGGARAVEGPIVTADFVSLELNQAIQWAINPGQVIFDILASKKRLEAAQQDELSVRIQIMTQAALQYYDLCLTQAEVAVALDAEHQAEELVRITAIKLKTGRAVPADEYRARASLAARQQDLVLALNRFYHVSVTLTTILHLDSTVTVVPRADQLTRVCLVREEFTLDQLLALAVENRPDLKGAYELTSAAEADQYATAWGGLGPVINAGYQVGGIGSRTTSRPFHLREEQGATAGLGWKFSLALFGNLETAEAKRRLAGLNALQQLDQLRAEVVRSRQDSRTNDTLIPMAAEEVTAAREGLHQTQANYRVGRAIMLDVLEAENALATARLRYTRAVVGYNQSQLRILSALGLLDAATLERSSDWSASATQPALPGKD